MVETNRRISEPKFTSDLFDRSGNKVNQEREHNVIRKVRYNGNVDRRKTLNTTAISKVIHRLVVP